MKRVSSILALLILVTGLSFQSVQADGTPTCYFDPDGSLTCTIGGGGGDDEGGGGGDEGGECVPGDHLEYQLISYDAGAGTCRLSPVWVDNCTGQILETAGDAMDDVPCAPESQEPENPCDEFNFTDGGIACENNDWKLSARVAFPEIYLDVRPFPATLVRWPTALRNGGLGHSSGSGGLDYLAYGGGSPSHPQEGDWQDLQLILYLRPAGPMVVSLPHIPGDILLPDGGPTGQPMIFSWEAPSHPAAGGGPLAGSIPGLEELPADIPLFVGQGRAPYRLFWEVRYGEYAAVRECQPGADSNGLYSCGGGTGHWVVTGYEWRRHATTGEIPPTAVKDLPPSLMADLNGDGTPEAFWNNNLTLRRMDEAGSVNNPRYRRSWNWGGVIYWAVREGQGQIGWPGR